MLVIVNYKGYDLLGADKEKYLPHIAFYLDSETQLPSVEVLQQTKLVEISDGKDIEHRIKALKKINPDIVVAVRINLNSKGEQRAIELGHQPFIEVLHLVADMNGNEIDSNHPKFVKDMVRHVHTTLVKEGVRDEITIIASGGIALAEHLAKQIICGADLISINLPLLIALECRLCKKCVPGPACPVRIKEIDMNYGAGRMINLLAAWHDQLIEVMGAMGIREAR
ncbi:MAG: glutamate synthase-related protein, partial [Chloroflexi bacterium]|nr:glutamate synthase-related protein [Chloroflexota bacterium]